MRIGMFTDYYLPVRTGVSYSVERFRKELESMGHEVFVFAASDSLRGDDSDPHIIRFPSIKGLFVENYLTSVFFPPQQVRKIEKLNLDIIHFHTPSQIGLLGAHTAIKNNIPLVTTYHTDLHEYTKTYPVIGAGFMLFNLLAPLVTGGGLKDSRKTLKGLRLGLDRQAMNQRSIAAAMTLLHNYCDCVIAPSKKMERQLKAWHTESKIVILPTGVDKITSNPMDERLFRAKFGLERTDKIVMYVGRLGHEKNLELLIKSFAKLAPKQPDAKLLLVGSFKHGDELVELAEKLGISDRVVVTGYIENHRLGALYACATVFALPSLTDTQCLVLNEAAHAGLPLVAVDPDINDVVQNDVNGYITKPTITAFSAAIQKVLNNPKTAKEMSTESKRLANKYSQRIQAKKLLEVYEQAIEDHRLYRSESQDKR